jgi:phosphinothricin acetyltransferase
MAPAVVIRPATLTDSEAIARIYNEGIVDRIATLETEERSAAERSAWLTDRGARYPVVVVESGGDIIGWGSLNPYSPRAAYRFVADLSVYVSRGARGQGVGAALLTKLIAEARKHEFHKIVLAAFPWNERGMRLYRRHGFREVGVYREQGLLDGKWVDTIVMELLLEEAP